MPQLLRSHLALSGATFGSSVTPTQQQRLLQGLLPFESHIAAT